MTTSSTPQCRMNLSDVIKIWDILHVKDTGELGFCDLEKAIDETIGVKNNISLNQPIDPPVDD